MVNNSRSFMRNLIVGSLLSLVAMAANSATVYQVAPNPTNKLALTRTTQPDAGKANVGAPCEAEVVSIVGKNEWHALKGTSPPHTRLAPCMAVTVPDPAPPVVIPPVVVPPVVPPPVVGGDFVARCAAAGVIRCIGFDTVADFNTGIGGTNGAYQQNFGIMPPSGTSDYTRATRDTSVKASGDSSLRFRVPSNTGSDTSGSYFANFSPDLSKLFGENTEFYVQWRQRFSPEFLSTIAGGGWKQVIIGSGDVPGGPYPASCTALETVINNQGNLGFPEGYNSCTGSSTRGAFVGFEEPFQSAANNFDFKLQGARGAPYCLYSQRGAEHFPPLGNCFGYFPNEWMTFQVKIKTGARVNDEWPGSTVTLWMAREGRASERVIEHTMTLVAGPAAENQRYGKIWLTPYNTGKDAAQVHPEAYTWYDELIISTQPIADPGAPIAVQPLPLPVPIPAPIPVPPPAPPVVGTSLLTLAASLQPGQWSPFVMGGADSSLLAATTPGSLIINFYAGRGLWDRTHRKLQFAGTSHTGGSYIVGAGGLITWDEATNQWKRESYTWSSEDPGHSYYHVTLNPAGDLFFRKFNSGAIYKLPYGATGPTAWQPGQVANQPQLANQVAGGLEWFPELNGGAGGLVFVDQLGAAWSNAALSAWTAQAGSSPSGPYNNWVARAGGFVYWGGGNGSKAMYRLSPTGVVSAMPATPLFAGNNTNDDDTNQAVMLAHPNGKDLLLIGTAVGGAVYRFDGTAWTSLGTHQVGPQYWIGFTVPDYGVVVFLRTGGTGGPVTATVYKP